MLPIELDGLIPFSKLPGRKGATSPQCHPRPEGASKRQRRPAAELSAEEGSLLIFAHTDPLRPAEHPADTGEGFGEGVDLLAERTPLAFVELLIADPAVSPTVRFHLSLQVRKAGLYLGHEFGVLTLYDGLDELEGDLSPLDVSRYVGPEPWTRGGTPSATSSPTPTRRRERRGCASPTKGFQTTVRSSPPSSRVRQMTGLPLDAWHQGTYRHCPRRGRSRGRLQPIREGNTVSRAFGGGTIYRPLSRELGG
jgi:hypothetical protein